MLFCACVTWRRRCLTQGKQPRFGCVQLWCTNAGSDVRDAVTGYASPIEEGDGIIVDGHMKSVVFCKWPIQNSVHFHLQMWIQALTADLSWRRCQASWSWRMCITSTLRWFTPKIPQWKTWRWWQISCTCAATLTQKIDHPCDWYPNFCRLQRVCAR